MEQIRQVYRPPLSGEQIATTLAALRHWQRTVVEDFDAGLSTIEGPHFDDCAPLNCEEIDELCETINCSGDASSPALREALEIIAAGNTDPDDMVRIARDALDGKPVEVRP